MSEEKSEQSKPSPEIILSQTAQALLKANAALKTRQSPDDFTKLSVSQTVSLIALIYEKIRNAIEYREEHLIRRAAIERILKRRLALNSKATGEAENLLRELMWARYFPNGSLGQYDIQKTQAILDKYLQVKRQVLMGREVKRKQYVSQFLSDLLTCEIEESLSPTQSMQESNFTYFIFQVLREKVKIESLTDEQRDAFLLIAIEKAYRKSDISYQRHHLFNLYYKPIAAQSEEELKSLITKMPTIFAKIDEMIQNPTVEKLTRFTRKQLPSFLILFEIIRKNPKDIEAILSNKGKLWTEIDAMCRSKYQQTRSRLNTLAFRSLIYIFITKMLLALMIEVPLSQLIYRNIHILAIAVNTIASPILMLFIILSVRIPNEENTKRIYFRIVDIINEDPTFEKTVALITKKTPHKRPSLVAGFTILYILTFVVTLLIINYVLGLIHFNALSKMLFIFFISIVSFFSYRIKVLANEYRLVEKTSIFSPVIDFFFMPILSLGKVFSSGVAHLNFFTVIFDFIIEAPFKLIIEVIEEWISFVKARKEDIV